MKFFMPNKEEIDVSVFVEKYSNDYFLKASGEKGLVPGLRRSSPYIEEKITHILCNGINDTDENKGKRDVARILAWKIGKIKHRASQKDHDEKVKNHIENEDSFVYSEDWATADELKGVHLYDKLHEFPIDDIATYLVDPKNKLKKYAIEKPQVFLNKINAEGFPRIGTVYMITLLYFLSRGKYPIYDRFAMLALSAIDSEKSPNPGKKVYVDVKFKELPSKTSFSRFETIMDNEMSIYEKKFNEAFGAYKKSITSDLTEIELKRKFDQALWVYGHLFTDDKKSMCR